MNEVFHGLHGRLHCRSVIRESSKEMIEDLGIKTTSPMSGKRGLPTSRAGCQETFQSEK